MIDINWHDDSVTIIGSNKQIQLTFDEAMELKKSITNHLTYKFIFDSNDVNNPGYKKGHSGIVRR